VCFLQERKTIPAEWWYAPFAPWILYGVAVVVAALTHGVLMRRNFQLLSIDEIQARWFIVNPNGDIESDFFYCGVRNGAQKPTGEFRPDREGFFVPLQSFRPVYSVVNPGQVGQSVEVRSSNTHTRQILVMGSPRNVYVYEQTLAFVPPLAKHSVVSVHRSYGVSASERDAFLPEGSYAGVRNFHPARSLAQQLVAPPHYRIELISYGVTDDAEQDDLIEIKRIPRPRVHSSEALIEWKIFYPKSCFRYWFKYRLQPLG
jgi:hypothetical protein